MKNVFQEADILSNPLKIFCVMRRSVNVCCGKAYFWQMKDQTVAQRWERENDMEGFIFTTHEDYWILQEV